MPSSVRQAIRRLLERTGLIAPYYRWLEGRAAHLADGEVVDDGRPMPPAKLRVLVSGPSQAWFSERGRADAEAFRRLAALHGRDLDAGLAVLDFGCGAGRIARWLAPEVIAAGGAFHGCDVNGRLVRWCAANLPGDYRRNRLLPPLELAGRGVDVIYAHSVLTHLAEATARAWFAEIARVLAPGGLALLTFHDDAYAAAWGPEGVAERLADAGYVVWNNAMEGSNYISAWTTHARLRALAEPWLDVVDILPGREEAPIQAVAIFRAKSAA